MDWQLPLVVSAAVFALFLLWKLRPSFGARGDGRGRAALREARKRVEAAKSDPERAVALCDAGDAAAVMIGGGPNAVGFYLRAMRVDPQSAAIIERASKALARRPRALESLLWRRLGAARWVDGGEAATRATLKTLASLYDGALRNPARARAMEFALEALERRA